MKGKKPILILLAALMLAMNSTALANPIQTEITASCLIPDVTIEVSVPVSGTVYLNPYKLPVELAGNRTSNAQIVSEPAYIENLSDVPVQVDVSAYGEPSGELELFAISTKGLGNIGKYAFVYFEMKAVSNPDQVTWDSAYDADKHLFILDSELTKTNIASLGSAKEANRFGAFRLSGDCVAAPPVPWDARDGVVVYVTFTFQPLPLSENP